jgi:hypothetical protein
MIPLHWGESTALSIGAANTDVIPNTKRIAIAGTPQSLINIFSHLRQKVESVCISEQLSASRLIACKLYSATAQQNYRPIFPTVRPSLLSARSRNLPCYIRSIIASPLRTRRSN